MPSMQCQIFDPEKGIVRCEFWPRCQEAAVCFCEVEVREANGLPPLVPRAKIRWAERREMVLELARERGVVSTHILLKAFGVEYHAAQRWVKRLVEEGELVKITPAIKRGPKARPATFALQKKGEKNVSR